MNSNGHSNWKKTEKIFDVFKMKTLGLASSAF